MTIKEIRNLTGLSQAAFSKKYQIPARTIQDWGAQKRTPPEYVVTLLDFKVRSDIENGEFSKE